METAEYERMYLLEDTYWWFQGRKRIIMEYLRSHGLPESDSVVVDVGCGTGLILNEMAAFHPVGVDFSALSMEFCRRRGVERLMRADVAHLPLRDNEVDLVLALDLLEHIEHDELLIEQFHRILKPGGHVMLAVPAHQSLWSDHDEALHHFRRYSRADILRLLDESGFEPIKESFAISATYVPIVVFRWLQRRFLRRRDSRRPKTHLIVLPAAINKVLTCILYVEAWWLRNHRLPFGVSYLCLARKT